MNTKARMTQAERHSFEIVHPLDDTPEEKIAIEHLGPMRMTRTVYICLFVLRGYMAVMLGLLAYRVMQLAGVLSSN